MDNQTLIIIAALICLMPLVTLAGLALLGNTLKKSRPARKRIKAEIEKNKVTAGQIKTQNLGEWVEVGEYDLIVHKITEQQRIHRQKQERIIYIDIEYRNRTEDEELSCRRNQWYVYSEAGHKYEAESDMTASSLYHDKHYFGSESALKPGMNVRGWLAFVLPAGARIRVLQFMTAFLGTKTAEFDVEGSVETEESVEEIKTDASAWFHLIEEEFGKINQAARDSLLKLPDDNIKKAIALSAEMAGLKLLRATGIDLSEFEPGSMVLGAVSDEIYQYIQRFIINWMHSNGLDLVTDRVEIPAGDKKYYPEVVQLEKSFDEICEQNNLYPEHFSYAAISAALKLLLAGKNMGLLDEKTGRTLILYHIVLGGKTVPYSPAD